jgi:hypothetical protein
LCPNPNELKGFPTLEIPEWMFNSRVCGRMKPAEFPYVDCATLSALEVPAIYRDGIE